MSRLDDDADLDRCWERLLPAARDLCRLIQTAPLSDEKRRVLSIYAAAHFFGSACGAMQQAPNMRNLLRAEIAEKVASLITDMMRKEEEQ